MIISDANGQVRFYKRASLSNNTVTFVGHLQANGSAIDIGECSTPRIADYNGDGLFDLLVSGTEITPWRVYLNTGTATKYKFTDYTVLTTYNGVEIWHAGISIVDFNKDGKMDLVANTNKTVQLCLNIGTNSEVRLADLEDITPDGFSCMSKVGIDVVDLNDDEYLDFLVPNGCQLTYALIKPFESAIGSNNVTSNTLSKFTIQYTKKGVSVFIPSFLKMGVSLQLFKTNGQIVPCSIKKVANNKISIDDLNIGYYILKINEGTFSSFFPIQIYQ